MKKKFGKVGKTPSHTCGAVKAIRRSSLVYLPVYLSDLAVPYRYGGLVIRLKMIDDEIDRLLDLD